MIYPSEHGGWIVQGVYRDVVAQGETLADAIRSFERTVAGEIALAFREQRPVSWDNAPKLLFDLFTAAPGVVFNNAFDPPRFTIDGYTFILNEEYRLCDVNPLGIQMSIT